MTTRFAPAPGPHGGDAPRRAALLDVAPESVLDLSVSLNPCPPDVASLVGAHAQAVRHYPDPGPATAALAEALDVDADRVVLTNGGAEAIALVAAELPAGRVDEPDFSLYARHLSHLDADAPRWRSNPHNPTGRLAAPTERAAVWDEAFYALATGRWTRGDDAVVVGSLTKLFACPGLRVGYVLAPDPVFAARIRRRQPRWSVNALACAILPELLAAADAPAWARGVATLRHELDSLLAAHGIAADPSDANYLLVRAAPGLRDHLARRGILVRDTASFGLPAGVRVAVPDPLGLDRVRDALDGWTR